MAADAAIIAGHMGIAARIDIEIEIEIPGLSWGLTG
jgi:hypothetical protein